MRAYRASISRFRSRGSGTETGDCGTSSKARRLLWSPVDPCRILAHRLRSRPKSQGSIGACCCADSVELSTQNLSRSRGCSSEAAEWGRWVAGAAIWFASNSDHRNLTRVGVNTAEQDTSATSNLCGPSRWVFNALLHVTPHIKVQLDSDAEAVDDAARCAQTRCYSGRRHHVDSPDRASYFLHNGRTTSLDGWALTM